MIEITPVLMRSPCGEPLALTLASLRGTGLTLAHAALGGDVHKTQLLANHADPSTTVRYVDRPASRRANAAVVAQLQIQFVNSIKAGILAHTPRATDPISADAHHVSASGFNCRDPLAGVAQGQRAGNLCTAWLGCFTCPNAVIPLNADVLARLLAMRDVLLDARKSLPASRWSLVYGPKLEILEMDILPRFPAQTHDAAMRILPQTFHPPKLE